MESCLQQLSKILPPAFKDIGNTKQYRAGLQKEKSKGCMLTSEKLENCPNYCACFRVAVMMA